MLSKKQLSIRYFVADYEKILNVFPFDFLSLIMIFYSLINRLQGQYYSGKYLLFRDYLWVCRIRVLEIKIFVEQISSPDADDAKAFGKPVTDRTVKVPEIVVSRYRKSTGRGICKSTSLINIGALQSSAEPGRVKKVYPQRHSVCSEFFKHLST